MNTYWREQTRVSLANTRLVHARHSRTLFTHQRENILNEIILLIIFIMFYIIRSRMRYFAIPFLVSSEKPCKRFENLIQLRDRAIVDFNYVHAPRCSPFVRYRDRYRGSGFQGGMIAGMLDRASGRRQPVTVRMSESRASQCHTITSILIRV